MDSDEIGGAAGAETSGIGAPAAPGRPLRVMAGRKRGPVLRLLPGEPLEIVAREAGVTAADLPATTGTRQSTGCGPRWAS